MAAAAVRVDGGTDVTSGADRAGWRTLEALLRLLSATIIVGGLCGALLGGVGGRLAMRLLLLTSDDAVRGVTSDDGFEIGRFSLAASIGLVVVTTAIGIVAALLFLVALPFVARLGRAAVPVMAMFYAVLGGAMLVHRGGVDFTLLEPAWLAISLFVAISGAFGAVVAWLLGRAAAPGAWPQRWSWWLLGPPLAALLLPPLLMVAIVGVLVNWIASLARPEDRWWPALRAAAFFVMVGLFVLATVDLARDAAALT